MLIAAQKPERVRSLFVLSRPIPPRLQERCRKTRRKPNARAITARFVTAMPSRAMRAARLEPLRKAMMDQGVPAEDAEVYVRSLLAPAPSKAR